MFTILDANVRNAVLIIDTFQTSLRKGQYFNYSISNAAELGDSERKATVSVLKAVLKRLGCEFSRRHRVAGSRDLYALQSFGKQFVLINALHALVRPIKG